MSSPCDDDGGRTTGVVGEAPRPPDVVEAPAGTVVLVRPAAKLVEALVAAKDVDPKLRQMVVLRVAKVVGAPREAQGGGPLCREGGLSPEEIEATASDGPVRGVALDCGLVCDAVDEMSEMGTLTDATLQLMLDCFGDTTIRTLVFISGCLHLLALFGEDCRAPMEAEDRIGMMGPPLA